MSSADHREPVNIQSAAEKAGEAGTITTDYKISIMHLDKARPEDEEFAHILANIIHDQEAECNIVPVERMKNVRARQFGLWVSE